MNVHVLAASVVRARPQLVPTNTICVLTGLMAICQPLGWVFRVAFAQVRGLSTGMFTACHVAPVSELTLIPDCGATRPSNDDVAYTRALLRGSTLTSQTVGGAKVWILIQVAPWLKL